MSLEDILREIKETLGLVPKFFEGLPDWDLEYEWGIFKRIELGETVIPNKYKELIGVGIAAATRCRYCSLFHTEAAKLFGATDAEIQDALLVAKNSLGWTTYLNGSQYDYDLFKRELEQIKSFLKEKGKKELVGVGRY